MDDFKNWSTRARTGVGAQPDRGTSGRPPQRALILRWLVVGGFVVFLIVAVILLARAIDWYQAHSPDSTIVGQSGSAKVVIIESGTTAAQIGNLLEQEDVIESSAAFVDLVTERGSENTLHPGKYTFHAGIELIAVVDMLETGTGSSRYKVLIPEGMAISQVKERLDTEGQISGAEYETLTANQADFELPSLAGSQIKDVSTMEGLLFPDTYFLSEGEGPDKLIEQQLLAFTNKTSALPWEKTEGLGVSPYQILIIASLIEKECRVPEERGMVARVIYNRLRDGMTLGIDATVRYAVNNWTEPLTDTQLSVDSPFNTRLKKGLPPSPICSPGEAALLAALEPVAGDWLYYVLKDTTGNHFFTSSYEEFLEAKANQPQE